MFHLHSGVISWCRLTKVIPLDFLTLVNYTLIL